MLTLPPLIFMLVSALFSFQRHQMLLVLYLCFGDSAYSRGLDYYRHPPGQVLPQPGAEQRYHFCSIAPAFSNSTSLPLMVAVAATIVVLTVAQDFRSNSGL